MKLAEALVQRADAKKRLAELQTRLTQNMRVQEGEAPHESPDTILQEINETLRSYQELIERINRTNAATKLADGRTITDHIAERDVLLIEYRILEAAVKAATEVNWRYSRSEIKVVATVDVPTLRQRMDTIAQRRRTLDLLIQRANWEVDLIE